MWYDFKWDKFPPKFKQRVCTKFVDDVAAFNNEKTHTVHVLFQKVLSWDIIYIDLSIYLFWKN